MNEGRGHGQVQSLQLSLCYFTPPRPLEEIDADLKACTERIKQMIEELSA